MEVSQQDIAPHLSDYYYVVIKHRWIIAFSLLAIVTLTALFTVNMEPVYQSSATLVIDQEQTASPLTGERMDFEGFASQTLTFNTHFKLIKSRPILEDVVKRLHLDSPDYNKDMEISPVRQTISRIKHNITLLLHRDIPVASPEEQMLALLNTLSMKINIEQVRDTRLLKINAEDKDPLQARDISNALAQAYIEFNTASHMKASKNTLDWVANQTYDMKKKLEDAEQEFLEYKQNQMIFSVEGKQSLITQKIEEFNTAYLDASNKRQELEAKLEELNRIVKNSGDLVDVRSLIGSPVITSLYSQMINLDTELSTLSKTYKDKHPKIITAASALDNTRDKLRAEIEKEIRSMRAEHAVLASKERTLQKTISDFESEALGTSKKELQYRILERNVETNQRLYDTLLTKAKEADVVQDVDTSNIRIVETAAIPATPIRPKKGLNMMLSVVLGLMAGVGLAFLLEYMDRTVRTEEDIQRYLNLPVLSVVPIGEIPKNAPQVSPSPSEP